MQTVDRRIRHDALFYDDEYDFVSAVVPFVREGIDAGEVVLVNTGTHPVTPLLRAMFSDEEQVSIAERTPYDTPANALDGYRRAMERGLEDGAAGFRAVGHIDLDATPLPWQEWLRYEAAVNRVFADYPFRTLCPYDTTRVPADVTGAMLHAHTGLLTPDGWRSNDEYVDPSVLVTREGLRSPAHRLQAGAPRLVMEPGSELMDLRLEIYAATMFSDLSPVRTDDFVKAVTEVVANAHRHGHPPVELRLWADREALVCTVTDHGPGIDDPLAGYARPRKPSEGLGLWAARQLCDILDYARGADGFTVRVASFH